MKKRVIWVAVGILAVCVIVLAVLWCTKGTFTMDAEELHIGQVLQGTTEAAADEAALREALDGQNWTCLPGGPGRLTVTEDTISIDGAYEDGPAHFVLEPDRALFYRSADGPFSFYTVENPEQLYRRVRELLD